MASFPILKVAEVTDVLSVFLVKLLFGADWKKLVVILLSRAA